MEHAEDAQTYDIPDFYETYRPIYGFDPRDNESLKDPQGYFDFVFTYRRIWSETPRREDTIFGVARPGPGDISMQNWLPGNDYNPGTSLDNLVLGLVLSSLHASFLLLPIRLQVVWTEADCRLMQQPCGNFKTFYDPENLILSTAIQPADHGLWR